MAAVAQVDSGVAWNRSFLGNPNVTITGITASITAPRTTGFIVSEYTPTFIHASGSGTTATGTSREAEDLEYRWTLERADGGGGWEAMADSEGLTNPVQDVAYNPYTDQVGFEFVAPVRYEHLQGGAQTQFRLTLDVRGQNSPFQSDSVTQTFTVDPFAGTTYFFDPDGGSDANDGLSSGAAKQTWAELVSLVGSNIEIVLLSGTTMTATGSSHIGADGEDNFRIGTYGGSTKATITREAAFNRELLRYIVNTGDDFADHCFSNIIFNDNGGAETEHVFLLSGAGTVTASYTYFDKCEFLCDVTANGTRVNVIGSNATKSGWGWWDCTFDNPNGDDHSLGIFGGGADWQFVVGGSFIGGGSSETLDHHIYPNFGDHACYRIISFGAASGRNYCINGNRPNDTSTGHDNVLIADCDFDGSGGILRGIDIATTNNDHDPATVEDIENVVIERNAFHGLAGGGCVTWGPSIKTIRDNVFWDVGAGAGGGDDIIQDQSDSNDRMEGNMRVYGNLSYVPSNRPSGRGFLQVTTATTQNLSLFMRENVVHDLRSADLRVIHLDFDITGDIDENQYYTPNDDLNFWDNDAGSEVSLSTWQGTHGFDTTVDQTDPGWLDPANGDFRTSAGGGGGSASGLLIADLASDPATDVAVGPTKSV